MATGFRAMGLGASTYFIPFFFVLEPALILQGTWQATVSHTLQVFVGIVLIAASIQGYLLGWGLLTQKIVIRLMLGAGGLLIALPGLASLDIDLNDSSLAAAGLLLIIMSLALSLRLASRRGG